MSRPEVIAFCSGDSIRNPRWTPEVCACGATKTPDGMPEVRIGNETHGVMICLRYEQSDEDFRLDREHESAVAERECLDDYEASRGVERG